MGYDPYEPFFHKASGQWCKSIGGKRHYLGSDHRDAKRRLAKLVTDRMTRRPPEIESQPVRNVVNLYLDHLKATKKPATYESQQWRLKRVAKFLPSGLLVRDLRRHHASEIEQAMCAKGYASTSIADTLASLTMALAWARDAEHIERNPLEGIRKPKRRQRSRVLTDAEFRLLVRGRDKTGELNAARTAASFRRVLYAMRWTGCRPCELRELRWADVRLDLGLWVLADHKTATQVDGKPPRMIALTEKSMRLCRWLEKRQEGEHVFLNAAGQPWTKDALCRAMSRARERVGLGKDVVLYTNRHTFATGAAGQIGDLELAALLGHTSTRTTQRYVHLNAERIKGIVKRLR